MEKITLVLSFLVALFSLLECTLVYDCDTGKKLEGSTTVQISDCEQPRCTLKKRTKVTLRQTFTPSEDIETLTTSVHAVILIIPLPFLGVDGTDACDKIFKASDDTPNGCPLKKGVEYIYKNEFPVLQIYPVTPLTVYWGLKEGNKTVTCFQVPARIV